MQTPPQRHLCLTLVCCAGLALHAATALADPFVDLGLNSARVGAKIANQQARITTNTTGLHLGVGVRRELPKGGDIGVRLELDDVDSNTLLAIRALDYRFNLSQRLAINAFAGAARLDLATPAYGYYFGGGVQFKDLRPKWDLSVDVRYGDKIARDNLLPTDPQGGSSDNFYDLTGISVYLSWRF
ncbi:MAG: hypothetical protein ABI640_09060 [Gammaproteobacteria bacterium]